MPTHNPSPARQATTSSIHALCGHFSARWVGLVKDSLIASRFGASKTLDLFFLTFTFINLIYSSFFGSVRTTLIPVLAKNESPGIQSELLTSALSFTFWTGMAILLILTFASPDIIPYIFPNISSDLLQQCILNSQRLALWAAIFALTLILQAGLHARKKFFIAAVIPAATPVVICIALLFSVNVNIGTLISALQIGVLVETIILLCSLKMSGLKIRLTLPRISQSFKDPLKQALLLSGGRLLITSTLFVDQFIAQYAGAGSVTILHFGLRIPAIVTSIAISSVGIVLLPYLSEAIAHKPNGEALQLMKRSTRLISLIATATCLTLFVFSEQIASLVFGYGQFSQSNLQSVSYIQQVYLMVAIAQIANIAPIRMVLALELSSALAVFAAAGFVLNLILDVVLMNSMGLIGIPLATLFVECTVGLLVRCYLRSDRCSVAY